VNHLSNFPDSLSCNIPKNKLF